MFQASHCSSSCKASSWVTDAGKFLWVPAKLEEHGDSLMKKELKFSKGKCMAHTSNPSTKKDGDYGLCMRGYVGL